MRTHEYRSATLWIPLADVHIAARRRRGVDVSTVERYRQWLEQGRDAPPVRLARHGDAFVIRDGRHRVAAALAAGHVVIEAEVAPGWRPTIVARLAAACGAGLLARRQHVAARASFAGPRFARG